MKVTQRLVDILEEARKFSYLKTIETPYMRENIFFGKYTELLVLEFLNIVENVEIKYSDESGDEKEQIIKAIKTSFRMD